MAQRDSGYERKARDAYMTPAWVTDVFTGAFAGSRSLARGATVWECAAGTGQMVERLEAAGLNVIASDIQADSSNVIEADFLTDQLLPFAFHAVVTNPPYKQAEQFVRRALAATREQCGLVAMLLAVDFDSAKTRADIFDEHPAWGTKIVLVDRIWWFDPDQSAGKKAQSPSANHAWFVWDWSGRGGRTTLYGRAPSDVLGQLKMKRKAAGKPLSS